MYHEFSLDIYPEEPVAMMIDFAFKFYAREETRPQTRNENIWADTNEPKKLELHH